MHTPTLPSCKNQQYRCQVVTRQIKDKYPTHFSNLTCRCSSSKGHNGFTSFKQNAPCHKYSHLAFLTALKSQSSIMIGACLTWVRGPTNGGLFLEPKLDTQSLYPRRKKSCITVRNSFYFENILNL